MDKFVWNIVKKKPEEVGKLVVENVPVDNLIGSRKFLTKSRYDSAGQPTKTRRASKRIPEGISPEGDDLIYLIDGHHKSRKKQDNGETHIETKILKTSNQKVINAVRLAASEPLKDLQIRDTENKKE